MREQPAPLWMRTRPSTATAYAHKPRAPGQFALSACHFGPGPRLPAEETGVPVGPRSSGPDCGCDRLCARAPIRRRTGCHLRGDHHVRGPTSLGRAECARLPMRGQPPGTVRLGCRRDRLCVDKAAGHSRYRCPRRVVATPAECSSQPWSHQIAGTAIPARRRSVRGDLR